MNAAAAPAAATMAPPTAGPTLRARLKPMELMATAAGRSSRGTMSPTEACHDGLFSAVPQPSRKVKVRSSQGVMTPIQAPSASASDTASMKNCAPSITCRRLKLSAMAPPSSENSMIGSEVEACTSATMSTESEIEVISQAAPTPWMSAPKLEARLAIQIERNVACRNGARGDGRSFKGLLSGQGCRWARRLPQPPD